MTLADLEAGSVWRIFVFLFGWAGLAGLIASGIGGYFAARHWPEQVDGVLGAAMTPVAVMAAAATLLFSNAFARLSGGDELDRDHVGDQIIMAVLYVVPTALYFGTALLALSMPTGTLVELLCQFWGGLEGGVDAV